MSLDKEKVCVLIPTLNEAPTIGGIVTAFRDMGFLHILVVDGKSSDKTVEIAESKGAEILVQSGKGKGNALIEAFSIIREPYILMLDGDGTYSPFDATPMLNPLFIGYHHVIGNRLLKMNSAAFSQLNLRGNHFLNLLFKWAHSKDLGDILSGYRAFTLESVRQMNLKESGFAIETEISAEAVKNGQKIAIVPISYTNRPGTATKLSPFHDGFKIMATIYSLAKMNNPLFYFGLIGLVIMFGGCLLGVYIVNEWLNHIDHLPLTVLTVLLIVVGFQIFMFGVISDMLLAYNREIIHEIQALREQQTRD